MLVYITYRYIYLFTYIYTIVTYLATSVILFATFATLLPSIR